jgi:xylulokinase
VQEVVSVGALVAGVDSSTQSTTVVVIDADSGVTVAGGKAPHVVTGSGGARETDPELWWVALRDALAATGHAADIAAISVAAQQHGLVVLDADGRPLRPAVLWNDTRSGPQTARLVDALGREAWATRIGTVPVPSITVTRWAWLRDTEPEVARATRAVRLPHDFLSERLCGRGVTDRGDASGTGWWSTATGTYDAGILALPGVELDPGMLPEVLPPDGLAGIVTGAAAAFLGIPAGIPVGPGSGDNAGAALGLGLRPGQPCVSLGTSGVATAVSERRAVDPSGTVAGFADATGRFLPLTATLNCTLAVDRMAGWLGLDRDAAASSDGVVVLPWFDGERTPDLPDAEGVILGLRHDTPPAAILGATYEGAVMGLLEALEAIGAAADPLDPTAPIVLIGGGARGETWRRTVQRLSGRPVRVPSDPDLVARGAAVQAAAVLAGTDPMSVHAGWDAPDTLELQAVPVDTHTIERIREVRAGVQAAVGTLRRGRLT